eukprot:m.122913 g.122913  ORF g.122913 m.122913 type:complete len:130 (+) comp15557_c0_seq3:282-671(+)
MGSRCRDDSTVTITATIQTMCSLTRAEDGTFVLIRIKSYLSGSWLSLGSSLLDISIHSYPLLLLSVSPSPILLVPVPLVCVVLSLLFLYLNCLWVVYPPWYKPMGSLLLIVYSLSLFFPVLQAKASTHI